MEAFVHSERVTLRRCGNRPMLAEVVITCLSMAISSSLRNGMCILVTPVSRFPFRKCSKMLMRSLRERSRMPFGFCDLGRVWVDLLLRGLLLLLRLLLLRGLLCLMGFLRGNPRQKNQSSARSLVPPRRSSTRLLEFFYRQKYVQ